MKAINRSIQLEYGEVSRHFEFSLQVTKEESVTKMGKLRHNKQRVGQCPNPMSQPLGWIINLIKARKRV